MQKLLILLLCLVSIVLLSACGGPDDTVSVNPNTGSAPDELVPIPSSQNQSADETTYPFGIKPDDHTVIWQISNITYVYIHDGKNVTGHTEYWDVYADADAAEMVAEATENGKPVDKEYKSVTARENYVIVEYNSDYFPIRTYDELMMKSAEAALIAAENP